MSSWKARGPERRMEKEEASGMMRGREEMHVH